MRPVFVEHGSGYHRKRARKPVQAVVNTQLVEAGRGGSPRESWLRWLAPYIAAVLLGAVAFAWAGWASGSDALVERTHAILMRFRPAVGDDETTEQRSARMAETAAAIVAAARGDRDVVAALVTLGWWESHYSQLVGEGRCAEHRYRCDFDKRTGLPKSRSYFQLQAAACGAIHTPGAPDVRIAAECAARLWRFGRSRCKSDAGAFALYGTGSRCVMPTADKRAAFMQRVLAQL